jgi:hypothetical protein
MLPKSSRIDVPQQKTFNFQKLETSLIVAVAAAFLFNSGSITLSHAQTPYYQGKTITVVVGTVAGDLYDLYARAFAQHMPKHIPGNPNMIVQNMPGAGHNRCQLSLSCGQAGWFNDGRDFADALL